MDMVKQRYIPDLIQDMAECDANYIRLMRLFPDMQEEDGLSFGVKGTTEEGAVVEITISERCPYTLMVRVTVADGDDQPWIRWPELEVRVYLDVKSAEVIGFQRHRNFRYRYDYPNPRMFLPDEKSQINKYLGELLTFCIAHGHSLTPLDLGSG